MMKACTITEINGHQVSTLPNKWHLIARSWAYTPPMLQSCILSILESNKHHPYNSSHSSPSPSPPLGYFLYQSFGSPPGTQTPNLQK